MPDFFDSERTPATIVREATSTTTKIVAVYTENGKVYHLELDSATYASQLGKKIELIYELSDPQKATVNKIWGYWLIPVELTWSFGVFSGLLGIAYATTHRPHPSAITEQLKDDDTPQQKYE